ncbi:uncharacterized protein BYT42DRAFT_545230 [Radiomyces spectabilis]|uniref:uncharacterized protein n=1 Tax=Radiomyces spectabilis TaxID=64574 RepID=UPI0022206D6F|nr:uncharacterized protein BYT42DRAFT_545230 [Radiomyces spectabilis]KAI8381324.1 hypothetical protein BYT42DRAFT_545230 [Radiomyces spectabilis]
MSENTSSSRALRHDTSNASVSHAKPSKQSLPVSIHPDDAKDKVFTAILKALLKMGNKPSSPKELANIIVKHKYATLGGATPFATVSSRISQHFKRAAEHKPPRPPLLAKHVDQNHSRKINYSLATESVPANESSSSNHSHKTASPSSPSELDHLSLLSDASSLSSEDESKHPLPSSSTASHSKRREPTKSHMHTRSSKRKKKNQRWLSPLQPVPTDADDESDQDTPLAKRPRMENEQTPSSVSPVAPSPEPSESAVDHTFQPTTSSVQEPPSDDESEADYSDYYEEMLKGDETMAHIEVNRDRRRSIRRASLLPQDRAAAAAAAAGPSMSSPRLMGRKLSLGNALTDHDIWTPYTFDQEFDNVFMSDATTPNQTSFNIASPESVSVSELDDYFASDPSGRAARKKSMSVNLGSKEHSLLQKTLLASSHRGNKTLEPIPSNPHAIRRVSRTDLMVPPSSSQPAAETKPKLNDLPPSSSETEKEQQESTSSSQEKAEKENEEEEQEEEEEEESNMTRMSYSKGGHHFTITRKVIGNLECYELDSPEDIPDTKILRFIASKDGATEHIALRTRHADGKGRRNSQYFYLAEGYVNATQLRKAAQPVLGKGSFDAVAESQSDRHVVTLSKGPMDCRGAWVPLSRARELVDEFEIESSPGLSKLLSDDPMTEEDRESLGTVDEEDEVTSITEPSGSTKLPDVSTKAEEVMVKAVESLIRRQSIQETSLTHTDTMAEDGDDLFVKFEDDDEPKPAESAVDDPPASVKPAEESSAATPTASQPPLTAADLLKTMNFQNLNLAALHQMSTTIPSLAHLQPTFDLIRSLATYMQVMAKGNAALVPNVASPSSTVPGTTSSSPSSTNIMPASSGAASSTQPPPPPPPIDFKALLARFPALQALLKREIPTPPATAPVTTPMPTPLPADKSPNDQTVMIHPTTTTHPPMYITLIDHVAVCVAVLTKKETQTEYRIMRRLDTGFINGTSLLTAGGIETESERSMILSLEMERVRMPNRASPLFGTWIPLRRAQELAVTCSIQNRLGPFLSDNIESIFPSPLPISVPRVRKKPTPQLTPLALSALRKMSPGRLDGGYLMSPDRRTEAPSQTRAAQLQQLLLTHPNKTLKIGDHKLKAPLLGRFDENNSKQNREVLVIDCPAVTASTSGVSQSTPTSPVAAKEEAHESDVDIVNDEASDEDTDTDTEVEEVRLSMKKMRDAAIDAMETGHSMDLEELLNRASSPIMHSSPQRRPLLHIRPPRESMKRRRHLLEDAEESKYHPTQQQSFGRRRPGAATGTGGKWAGGGKWAAGGGKTMPTMIKRSASWNGALSSTRNPTSTASTKKQSIAAKRSKHRQKEAENEEVANRVVEHKSTTANESKNVVAPPTKPASESPSKPDATTLPVVIEEDDEDEEISIGGSDGDDDLR